MMTGIYLFTALLIAVLVFLNRKTSANYILVALFGIIQVLFTVYAGFSWKETNLGYFTFDSPGLILLVTLSIITIPAIYHSYVYINRHNETAQSRAIYFAALIILLTSISAGYLANHIAVIWIFTELTTLSASALIYHHRNKLALEGTWKYVFICAISITFVFIGILFLSLALRKTGSSDLSFSNLMINRSQLDPFWLKLSFVFIFTGLTAKLGLFPMYTAGIDAKDKAPAPAGALLASVLMNLGFIGIFRFYAVVSGTSIHNWASMIIYISAFISIFVAAVYMSRVLNIKRMLAYSGIEHMGIVMLGVAAGGIGYYAAILHVVLHAFVKSSMFFQYNQLFRVFGSKNITDTGNYFRYNPAGAIVLLTGFICATAMPPSGLFVSEFLVFRSLFEREQFLLMIVVLLLLTIIIYAFGKNVMRIVFVPADRFDDRNVQAMNPWESASQYFLIILAVWLGLNPPAVFVSLIKDAISIIPS
ncbi:MAG TPA: proton-conducting transporter membrane subunit [Bacteroidales bacterium]|nr:proton-conducting transporter membrane subunit [Bacteroidales bacterium]